MPEHGAATPTGLGALESFLWHDFEAGAVDWKAWVRRKLPDLPDAAADAAFQRAMQLHDSLRALQAVHSGIPSGEAAAAREALNRLIAECRIQPRLGTDGALCLASQLAADPVARLVLAALEAVRSGDWPRFKLCRDPTCGASYYDASRAAARTWCSMRTCGSRNKMRRYRARI